LALKRNVGTENSYGLEAGNWRLATSKFALAGECITENWIIFELSKSEIAMRVYFSQTKMIIWLFHATIKNQIINA